ncbi:beta strand repeat-containing protein [Patescibacteria group bacterium]
MMENEVDEIFIVVENKIKEGYVLIQNIAVGVNSKISSAINSTTELISKTKNKLTGLFSSIQIQDDAGLPRSQELAKTERRVSDDDAGLPRSQELLETNSPEFVSEQRPKTDGKEVIKKITTNINSSISSAIDSIVGLATETKNKLVGLFGSIQIHNLALAGNEIKEISGNGVRGFAIDFYRRVSGLFGGMKDDAGLPRFALEDESELDDAGLPRSQELAKTNLSSYFAEKDSEVVQTTIISPIQERVREVVIERVVSGLTTEDLQQLSNELRSEIYRIADNAATHSNQNYQAIALTNKIDNLTSVTIGNARITGGTITGASISGTIGNFSETLTLSGALTGTTGEFSGNLSTAGNFSTSGQLTVSGTATSTMAGDFAFDTDTLYVDSVNNRVGVGTTSPFKKLSVSGDGWFDGLLTSSSLNTGTLTATSSLSSPYFTATDSNATSTFAGGISVNDITVTNGTSTRANLGLTYATQTDINFYNVATWGDSLTVGMTPQLEDMYPSHFVYNGGIGGEISTEIKDRMVLATDKYDFVTMIWAGNNNATDPTTVKADIATMISNLTDTKRYVVLGMSINSTYPSGTGTYTTIKQLNTDLGVLYPNNYIDIHDYLVNNALTDAGITPTAQDLIDIGNDVVPDSLRTDTIHLTTTGYRMVSQQIINFINSNYPLPTTDKVFSYTDIDDIFSNPAPMGTFNIIAGSQVKYNNEILAQASTTLGNYFFGGAGTIADTVTGINNTAVGDSSLGALVSGDYNTALGYQALYIATSSSNNTAIGYRSLYSNTTGTNNTAIGMNSLKYNTTGNTNTAQGYGSLLSNTTGDSNTAFGYLTLTTSTSTTGNTAVGNQSLRFNTTGNYNTASGYYSLQSNTEGSRNTAVGYNSLFSNTTGNYNTANGYLSLSLNTTGSSNTANGYQTLQGNITGISNTAFGYESLKSNTSDSNSAFGHTSLLNNTTGGSNTAIGKQSLGSNTTGNYNIAFGLQSNFYNASATSTTAIGYQAGRGVSGQSYNQNGVLLGHQAGYGLTTGDNNLLLGYGG